MRILLRAFEEVPPAGLGFDFSERPRKMFKQRKRNKELQGPIDGIGYFRQDNRRQGGVNLDSPGQFQRDFGELLETAGHAFWIGDVATEVRAAAIEFKIEVAFVGFWLHEKFHATVFPDFVHVIRPLTAHVTVANVENSVNAFRIEKQARGSLWAMVAAFGSEIFKFVVGGQNEGLPSLNIVTYFKILKSVLTAN